MTEKTPARQLPANAFLIVNGAEIFPLTKPIVNIGRMADNDLVIDDSRISRHHAQLRAEKGRYILIDLKSTGGTSIDGEPVAKAILEAGNIITLAGIPLIYGQDAPGYRPEDLDTPDQSPSLKSSNPTVTDSTDIAADDYLDMFDPAPE